VSPDYGGATRRKAATVDPKRLEGFLDGLEQAGAAQDALAAR
jgi:hypothetical protein